jgi:hypothetical protein
MKYSYAREKLAGAISTLATHPEDARFRVIAAFEGCHTLNEKHFPEELRKQWREIEERVQKRGPVYDQRGEVECGAIENTMKRMQKRTAAEIANKICLIYERLKMIEDI